MVSVSVYVEIAIQTQLAAALEGAKCLLYFFFGGEGIADIAADLFELQYKVGLFISMFNCSSTFLCPCNQVLEASHVPVFS